MNKLGTIILKKKKKKRYHRKKLCSYKFTKKIHLHNADI